MNLSPMSLNRFTKLSSLRRLSVPAMAISVAVLLAACQTPPVTTPGVSQPSPRPTAQPGPAMRATSFSQLPGWNNDDLREAWPAVQSSCSVMIRKPEWRAACAAAQQVNGSDLGLLRQYFETYFTPYQLYNQDGTDTGLVTGYYEPLLRGSRRRSGPYQTPLYQAPDDLLTIDMASVYPELKNLRLRGKVVGRKVLPYPTRAELMQGNALAGKEIVWVDDPVEAFFLQVQGSGRVYLPESRETIRLAYADQNGRPYKSIGRYLVDKGEMELSQASAQNIKAWVQANPARKEELLNANPSYVFFKEEKLPDPSKGPKGAQGIPLTPQRSIAIDPQHVPLGAPVFLATTLPNSDRPLQRLVVAQDTGGAIRGVVRADYFWGFGDEAEDRAGSMKQRGMMWVLLPKGMTPPSGN
ncbi:murein transglycosylase A [Herbaspirillum seropedicae]|uniref:murein transglycosylase A n=1 Tax=Herbaspirillum seropedicae TaxID=964 RepID=UPI00084802B5|nr:murein transglycosylase A [Herbaspirillum seropedicae]AON56258.1 membrane-bound lytic murein transglycosylase [Herbaspirillum seropedicae]